MNVYLGIPPPEGVAWIAERAGFSPTIEFRALTALDDRGRIHGMVGFDGWTPNSVVAYIALDNPAALRHLVPAVFEVAFEKAERGVMLATCKGSNTRSLKLCKHLGMKEVYRVRDGVQVGDDLVILEMRREDCRWLQRKAA